MSNKLVHNIRLPVLLVADASPSMAVAADPTFCAPIKELNRAIANFVKRLRAVTHVGVDLMTLSFADDVQVEHPFEDVLGLTVPELAPRRQSTNLGGAIGRAVQEMQAHRDYMRASGIQPKMPWLICISDGQSNMNTCPGFDTLLVDLINRRKVLFLPVAVGGYSAYDQLAALSPLQPPIVIGSAGSENMSFEEYFQFLSDSASAGVIPNQANLQAHHE